MQSEDVNYVESRSQVVAALMAMFAMVYGKSVVIEAPSPERNAIFLANLVYYAHYYDFHSDSRFGYTRSLALHGKPLGRRIEARAILPWPCIPSSVPRPLHRCTETLCGKGMLNAFQHWEQ